MTPVSRACGILRSYYRLTPKGRKQLQAQQRYYLVAAAPETRRFEKLDGKPRLVVVRESGGKCLFTNR